MKGSGGGGPQSRAAKRSRLGNAQQRALYKSAHGYKNKEYADLCAKADRINNRK